MSICTLLIWDSEFFGRRIARVNGDTLTLERIVEIEAFCRAERIECVYFLASANDAQTATLAALHQFMLVDIRMTLDVELSTPTKMPDNMRPAISTDLAALKAIAGESFADSRFYHDPHFAREDANRLYQVWIEQQVHNQSDVVWVADHAGEVAGFITCSFEAEQGVISLIGVDKAYHGRGIGSSLVGAALSDFSQRGLKGASVVTQGRNIPAQRLYQKHGFRTHNIQYWYHKWLSE
jgi:ribosomal protein S18 acetylase RimI-like enzyme